jgi:DNA-binding NarL/FixJ family response regulator
MYSHTTALVIAGSTQMRESLLVLLRAIPQIETVHPVEDLQVVPVRALDPQPGLVLLDHDKSVYGLGMTLGQIKSAWPQVHCIVFLDEEQDRHLAVDAGADVVLLKGMRADTILEQIERILA